MTSCQSITVQNIIHLKKDTIQCNKKKTIDFIYSYSFRNFRTETNTVHTSTLKIKIKKENLKGGPMFEPGSLNGPK